MVKPMLGFKNFKSACSVISGIEVFHMLKKGQCGKLTPVQEIEFINSIMNVWIDNKFSRNTFAL
jgi:transposase, IS6 family